jgi:CRP-like cAMP-binding protein
MTESMRSAPEAAGRLSLSTAAARNLATTTKSRPQMQGISSRWLLRMLPWVHVSGGTYRVNRRLTYPVGVGRVSFTSTGSRVQVIPPALRELPLLRGFDDAEVLETLAGRFTQREFQPGGVIVAYGRPADQVVLIAHGRARKTGPGRYDEQTVLGTLANGDHFGDQELLAPAGGWEFTVTAQTPCTVLALPRQAFEDLADRSATLRAHVERLWSEPRPARNRHGEATIEMAAGHSGEPVLPGTFVDYEISPREYELGVAQTVLRVHTRVADLYNDPMNQVEEQLRLTIEALRERQEHELINNREFGLLHNVDLRQRVLPRTGPPTPDDLDELLSRRRKSQFFLAHPRTIAAFGRECSRQGLYPQNTEVDGHAVSAWRGVPLLPCDKIPITRTGTSSILVLRTGEQSNGVIGLHETGIPDEYHPGLSVRLMGIDAKAISSYLVSTYFSAAVLVPDALGSLENVHISL